MCSRRISSAAQVCSLVFPLFAPCSLLLSLCTLCVGEVIGLDHTGARQFLTVTKSFWLGGDGEREREREQIPMSRSMNRMLVFLFLFLFLICLFPNPVAVLRCYFRGSCRLNVFDGVGNVLQAREGTETQGQYRCRRRTRSAHVAFSSPCLICIRPVNSHHCLCSCFQVASLIRQRSFFPTLSAVELRFETGEVCLCVCGLVWFGV